MNNFPAPKRPGGDSRAPADSLHGEGRLEGATFRAALLPDEEEVGEGRAKRLTARTHGFSFPTAHDRGFPAFTAAFTDFRAARLDYAGGAQPDQYRSGLCEGRPSRYQGLRRSSSSHRRSPDVTP